MRRGGRGGGGLKGLAEPCGLRGGLSHTLCHSLGTASQHFPNPFPTFFSCRLSMDNFEKVVELAQQGCRSVAEYMRSVLLEHTRRLATARGAVKV